MTSNGNSPSSLSNVHNSTATTTTIATTTTTANTSTPTFTPTTHHTTPWLPHQNQNTASASTSTTTSTTTQSSSSSPSKPKQIKGILKNPYNSARKRRIVWDEANLNFNEENKSATMKISEPKTPYHYYDSEDEEIDVEYPNEEGKWGMLETAVNREKIRQLSDIDNEHHEDLEGSDHGRFSIAERDKDSEEGEKAKPKRKTKGYDVWYNDDMVKAVSINDNVNSENIEDDDDEHQNGEENEDEDEDENENESENNENENDYENENENNTEEEGEGEVEGSTSESDDVSRKKEFKEKRKAHYNEFEMIRKMRELKQKGVINDEDDDENHARPNFFSGLVKTSRLSNGTSEEEEEEGEGEEGEEGEDYPMHDINEAT